MSFTSSLAGIFDYSDQAAMQNAQADAQNVLKPGSPYWQSGNLGLATPGSQGNALVNAAAQLGARNIGVNYTPMDQDAAALQALGAQYQSQFANGGKAEAAARDRAVASMADAGGGGIAGSRALLNASQNLSQQAESTSLAERGQSASQANQSNLEAGMLAIRKMALQAAQTHASVQKGIAAQGAINTLQNDQANNDLRLQQGAISGQHSINDIGLGVQAQENQTALGVLAGGASAVGAATALGAAQSKKNADASVLSESEIQSAADSKLRSFGIDPSTVNTPTPAVTGQAAALTTQNALNKALGTTTSKVTYPTLQSDVSSYLTDPSAYPLTTSVR